LCDRSEQAVAKETQIMENWK